MALTNLVRRHPLLLASFFSAIVVAVFCFLVMRIMVYEAMPVPSSASSLPALETDKEMEQRLKWHWAAINKCRSEGGHAAMGFDDEVLCLRYASLWWSYDGKGPP